MAFALLLDQGQENVDAVDRTPQVDVDDPLPVGQLHLVGGGRDADASVVAQHVHPAIGVDRKVGKRLHLFKLRHIARPADNLGPGLGQFLGDPGECTLVEVADDQLRSGSGERPGHTETNAACSTGDDGHAALKVFHVMLLSSCRLASSRLACSCLR